MTRDADSLCRGHIEMRTSAKTGIVCSERLINIIATDKKHSGREETCSRHICRSRACQPVQHNPTRHKLAAPTTVLDISAGLVLAGPYSTIPFVTNSPSSHDTLHYIVLVIHSSSLRFNTFHFHASISSSISVYNSIFTLKDV